VADFAMVNPEVLQLRASQSNGDAKHHIEWRLSFSPDPVTAKAESGPERVLYPVIGSLHVGGPSGFGDISVGALLIAMSDPEADGGLQSALEHADAVEALYDVARGHLGPLLRSVDCVEELPKRSPKVVAEAFERPRRDKPKSGGRRKPVADGERTK
jgi:hypothetical protein